MSGQNLLDQLGVVGTALKKVAAFWQKQTQGRQRLIIVIGVTLLLLAGATTLMLNNTQYTVLYTNLASGDAGEILAQLKESGIDAKAEGTGTILVPADRVDSIRMELAAAGYPRNSANLDILGQSTGFGMTDEDKAIYRRYQLQQDLQNAIKTFDSVLDARVSLNIPKTSSFVIENQRQIATAAVLLTLRPGTSLTTGNIDAIASLVEKSVPGLSYDNISIVDSNMNVLSQRPSSNGSATHEQLVLQQQISDKLKNQVLNMLQPVFGPGNVLAEVNVTLDFDRSTVESIRFEPAGGNTTGIISSINKIRESSSGSTTNGSGAGTDSNGGAATYPVVNADNSVYEKTSENINYEINTIRETLVKSEGAISQLSVSVILNAADSQADYSDNVRKLVSSAIGVAEEHITVDKLPFSGQLAGQDTWQSYIETNDKAMKWEQTRFFILLAAGLLLSFLLIIIVAKAIRGSAQPDPATRPAINGRSRQELAAAYDGMMEMNEDIPEDQQEVMAILSDASSIQKRKIENYFDKNPELAASILRSWLNEEMG